ncbi:ABC transporter permease subunit [Halioxenophilus sp. WMMB6]|uniref:ABC transporter permease subunit n=1 Tax=Halioxenophilus sp. WMMB6 TaxID=3073815 RepID=UPI00295EBF85|nr:ABC transporter permease subunit [Halioxenophilus sp. WMMB6]
MIAIVKRLLPPGKFWVVLPPYLWLLLFFAIPFLIIFKISLSKAVIAQPPYTPLFEYAHEKLNVVFNFGNYLFLFSDSLYINAYLSSLKIAAISTLFCLLIGYPIAYTISRMKGSLQSLCLMLVILPSWTSFLIRVYAWMGILKNNGIINNVLMWMGVIDEPIRMLNTEFAVYIGIVYTYLPFMVLPLYANLVKLDIRFLEAAADLGAGPVRSFFAITLPLSRAGIIAGSMLVFIPAVGEFVIPELLGGAEILMIGKVLWGEFFGNRDWPVASAVATLMLIILIVPIILFHRYQFGELEEANG